MPPKMTLSNCGIFSCFSAIRLVLDLGTGPDPSDRPSSTVGTKQQLKALSSGAGDKIGKWANLCNINVAKGWSTPMTVVYLGLIPGAQGLTSRLATKSHRMRNFEFDHTYIIFG